MSTLVRVLIASMFVLVVISYPAFAHHSKSATYKSDAPIEVQGVVTNFSFRNPHILIRLEVTNSDNSITEWVVEGGAATGYRGRGWDNETFKPGDLVQVNGASTIDGSPMVHMNNIQHVDAQTGKVAATENQRRERPRPQQARVPLELPLHLADGIPNVSGFWGGHRISPYNPPKDPQFVYNEAGSLRQAAISRTNDPQVFCERPGLIRQGSLTSYVVSLEQLDDRVIFEYEEYGFSRTIYFDDRNAKGVHSHFGDSVARYEGDTLVIETTNLLPDWASPEGNRLSDQTKVVERYRRADEAQHGALLHIESTISDPVFLQEDYVLTNIKLAIPEIDFIENGCEPPLRDRTEVHPYMNFFLASESLADDGGLEDLDAYCTNLASEVGQGDKRWFAYHSNAEENDINPRDGIGSGPWYNANGELLAMDLEELHSDADWLSSNIAVDQQGRELYSATPSVQDASVNDGDRLLYCLAVD
ncbi:MAG: hypothetical protein KTR16_14085 [Acidiferrobacterales bacterium]|nr:hypothetical protein [Acidiferrobacterales bacterium]